MGGHKDIVHTVLSDGERSRFISEGTGSDASDRWLQAVLGIVGLCLGTPCDVGSPEGRAAVVGPGGGAEAWKKGTTAVVNMLAYGERIGYALDPSFMKSCREPMMVNALDTLIRFAVTRHDVTGPLCGGRGPDASALIGRTIAEAAAEPADGGGGPESAARLMQPLARHMLLPVIVHAGDPADDLFDAISAGHVRNRISWPILLDGGPSSPAHLYPLSSCMPYDGPHCGPRLAAMWAGRDALEAEISSDTPVSDPAMLVTSMPGAADMGIPAAIDAIIGLQTRDTPPGAIPSQIVSGGGVFPQSLPPMDWDTYNLVMSGGTYARDLQFAECVDETFATYRKPPEASRRRGGAGKPGTWTRLLSYRERESDRLRPWTRGLFMSDVTFITGLDGGAPDPTLAWDALRAAMYPLRHLGCGDARLEEVAACAAAYPTQETCMSCIREAAIHLHDPDLFKAGGPAELIESRLTAMLGGDAAIERRMMHGLQHGRSGRRDDDPLLFLGLDDLERFFGSLKDGYSIPFAMETLMSAVRRFRCGDPVPEGIRGLADTTPCDKASRSMMAL